MHNRIGIVDRRTVPNCIAVIPLFHIGKVRPSLLAHPPNLVLRKAKVLRISSGIQQRILLEIRNSRLGAVFFYRKDAGHVGGRNCLGRKIIVFEPASKEIQVTFLCICIVFCLTDDGIPLIDYDKNACICRSNKRKKAFGQRSIRREFGEGFMDILKDSF